MRRAKSGAAFRFTFPRRLIVVFLLFVFFPYAVGMGVAVYMGRAAIPGEESAYITRVSALAEQLDTELSRIESQIHYQMGRTPVQYMSLVSPSFAFRDIYAFAVETLDTAYALCNSSGLLESATIYFPLFGRKIMSDGSLTAFNESDLAFVEQYHAREDLDYLAVTKGKLCMVSDSMRVAGQVKKANSADAAVLLLEFSDRILGKWCNILPGESRICLLGEDWDGDAYFLSVGDQAFADAALRADLEQGTVAGGGGTSLTTQRIDGQDTLRILSRVGERQLWVGCYMDPKVVRRSADMFNVWQIALTAFLLLEVGVFFYLMRKMIVAPINRFAGEVERLAKEGVLRISDTPQQNDMDFLYEVFQDVSGKLQSALEQSYKNKVLIYQAEIKYLQAQVNPHFLYNCFYHLYRMAKMEDNEGVAEMSSRFSSYYRYITRSDQNEVPLEMEYKNIVDYTDIQSIRFGNRIEVNLQPLPEDYKHLIVPRFVLQPLFENAYYHGVEKMTAGKIQLQFCWDGEKRIILVENNGECSDEELAALTAYLSTPPAGGKITALKNVKSRMALLGGDLTISRGSLGGFCAALTLPSTAGTEETEGKNNADASDRG